VAIIQNDESFAKSGARIELISSMPERAVQAPPFGTAAIQNDEFFANSRARIELITSMIESALRALPCGAAIIQNDECFPNRHGQKLHVIVHILLFLVRAELEWSRFFSFRNQLFELYHLAEPLLKMEKLLKTLPESRSIALTELIFCILEALPFCCSCCIQEKCQAGDVSLRSGAG
jgi:hypothetical protein